MIWFVKLEIGWNYSIILSIVPELDLAKPRWAHAMVNLEGDLVVIGGQVQIESSLDEKYLEISSDLLRLTCYNRNCNWEKLSQQLKNPRSNMVALVLPDEFLECS